MNNYRDRFPVYVGLSLTLHVAAVAFIMMLPPQRSVRAQESVRRFTLLAPGLVSIPSPGGAPLGEPAPAPLGRPAHRPLAHRISQTSQTEPVSSPALAPPKVEEQASQSVAPISGAPSETAASFSQPSEAAGGGGEGGSQTGTPVGTGEGGNGRGGSPDGCVGCKGGQRGRGSGFSPASDWKAEYKKKVFARIQSAKQYPYVARRAGMEGRVVVKFTITRAGTVASLRVIAPCAYPILNSDALEWVQRASPFPPFPPDADETSLSFTYGLRYELTE